MQLYMYIDGWMDGWMEFISKYFKYLFIFVIDICLFHKFHIGYKVNEEQYDQAALWDM